MKFLSIAFLGATLILQITIVWYWGNTDAVDQFSKILAYQNNGLIPAWSSLAFTIGAFWLIVFVATIAVILWAKIKKVGIRYGHLALINSLVLVLMVYAMYPLHVLLKGV